MTLSIEPADFEDPSLGAFLEAHLADMAQQSPLESQHALDLASLRQPTVRLWAAQKDHRIVGTCALAVLEPGHEELKSMRTDPDFRGQGVALPGCCSMLWRMPRSASYRAYPLKRELSSRLFTWRASPENSAKLSILCR